MAFNSRNPRSLMESDDRLDLETAIQRWRAASVFDEEMLRELETHLRDAVSDGVERGLLPAEAFSQALGELGDSVQLADEFSKVKENRSTAHQTMTMKTSLTRHPRLRRLGRQIALAIAIAVPLRAFVLAPYRAAGASVAPEVPAGSHIIVWQLAPKFSPGDIAAYRDGGRVFLGRVATVGTDSLTVDRAQESGIPVSRKAVIGRVILSTR
jgi:hypothetical protein